jgi:hypothetical protein
VRFFILAHTALLFTDFFDISEKQSEKFNNAGIIEPPVQQLKQFRNAPSELTATRRG